MVQKFVHIVIILILYIVIIGMQTETLKMGLEVNVNNVQNGKEKMKNVICSRKFGKTLIEINYNGSIVIVDDWFANWGIIYPNMIEIFKTGKINPVTGHTYQVIGMDTQPSKTHVNWIESKIMKGYFDHLIND